MTAGACMECDSTGCYSTSGKINCTANLRNVLEQEWGTDANEVGEINFLCAMQACKDDFGVESVLTDGLVVSWS